MKLKNSLELSKAKENAQKLLFTGKIRINVGTSTCCIAKGADLTFKAIKDGLNSRNMDAALVQVGCSGFCHMEPTIEVHSPGKPKIIYGNVSENHVSSILDFIAKGKPANDLAIAFFNEEDHVLAGPIHYSSINNSKEFSAIKSASEIDFIKKQHKLILRNAGRIDPENISEYIALNGYEALVKALTMKPKEIIDEVTKSGLRGRGGGGFPTGLKWKSCIESKGNEKYIICNVSEGEPGIGMHRSFLESDPHSVLEGLIISAYAIGAQTGYVYIRDNYRVALKRFKKAVNDATEAGLLGNKILGSSFSLNIKIKEGGGRFVCGEETSLISCLEGKIGEPRQRPPFPTIKGIFGKPTCINNVETLANIPIIILKGSSWYSSIGSDKSKGTKVISLAGNIQNSGMIEVDMCTSLKEVIYGIGGGIDDNKKLKGIQTGGPSGGVLPKTMEQLTVDYDDLKNAGSLLGSGGMVFMDDHTDMVKIARYFTDFFAQESCGKCVPCREGVCRMRSIMDEIIAGRGKKEDLSKLTEMSEQIMQASACALGKTAPTPILSTMKHFQDDYLAYIK
jgi:NADH:ubiquinone oxidoreductase subunit F (NADH-binding)/(2Fe-2S) ferredoxin